MSTIFRSGSSTEQQQHQQQQRPSMRRLAPILGGSKVRIRRLGIGGLAAVLWVVLLGVVALPALAAPEAPKTEPAKAVTGTSAVLEGTLNPGVEATAGYYFDYSTGVKCTSAGAVETAHEGEEDVKAKLDHADVTGLEPNTKYEFCMFATEGAEVPTQSLNEVSFKTKALKPKITPASEKIAGGNVKASTEATFEASINPNNEKTTYAFEYATTEAALLGATGTTVAGTLPPMLEGDSEVPIGVTTSAPLAPGTTYFYRAKATNATGTSYGTVQSFTTVPAPVVETPSPIGTETATLKGTLNPLNGSLATQYSFDYALLPSKCTEGSSTGGEAGTGSGTKALAAGIEGLQPNAEYEVCLVATNSFGSETSAPVTFKTLPLPPTVVVGTESASAATSSKATLAAEVNPNNQETTYEFEYATNKALTGATKEPGAAPLTGLGNQPASVTPSGLKAGETYFYRVVATNEKAAKTEGEVESFTTVPAPTTEATSLLTATTITFNGHLAPLNKNVATQYHFSYKLGSECANENATPAGEAGKGEGGEFKATANVTELQPGHEYTVCFVTSNEFGSEQGAEVHFTTLAGPPTIAVGSETVSGVKATEATLEAQVNPNNQKTTYEFEYSTVEAEVAAGKGTKLAGTALEGFGNQTASVTPTGLKPATKYFYRATAENISEKATPGEVESFTSAPEAPETKAATLVTATTATFNGALNPKVEAAVGYYFAYNYKSNGTCEAGPTTEPVAEPVAPAKVKAGAEVLAAVTLEPSREYLFCLVATNAAGAQITVGNQVEVKTLALAPEIYPERESASGPTAVEATFNAVINPNDQPTTYEFEYSTEGSVSGNTLTGTVEKVPGAEPLVFPPNEFGERGVGASTGPVLEPGQVYYYRVSTTNGSGTTKGAVEQFSKAPIVEGQGASAVTPISAKLEATVNPYFQPTSYFFEYSTEGIPGTGTPGSGELKGTIKTAPGTSTLSGEFGGQPVGAEIAGLTPNQVYFFRVVAENETTRTPSNKVKPSRGEVVELHAEPAVAISGESASGLETSEATLNASIYPGDAATTYQVEYEPGKFTPLQQLPASGETVAVHVRVGGLRPGVEYHARFLAGNELGSAEGAVPPFTIPAPATSEEPPHGPAGSPPAPSTPASIPSLPVLSYPEAPALAGGSAPAITPPGTKALTKAQKLAKALKACHKRFGAHPPKQRTRCEVAARKQFGSKRRKK